MADMWVGVNGADEALRQVNAEMLGGARALADQAAAQVVAIVWGASAAGHAQGGSNDLAPTRVDIGW